MHWFLVLVIVVISWQAEGFVSQNALRHGYRHGYQLSMALIPIGPFCPYSSSMEIESKSGHDKSSRAFAQEFSQVQADLQLGKTPDAEKLQQVADNMDLAIDRWEDMCEKIGSTPDFRAKEYACMADSLLNEHGTSSESIAILVRWQSSCMRALAEKKPPPMPPQELDLQRLMDETNQDNSLALPKKKPSISAMQEATMVTAIPLDETSFESESILEEYKQLVQDHSGLIAKGANYEKFDPKDKLIFLDLIELIEARWDSLLDRCESPLQQEYVDQCHNYLECMKLTEDEFRHLLNVSHRRMRQDAERQLETTTKI